MSISKFRVSHQEQILAVPKPIDAHCRLVNEYEVVSHPSFNAPPSSACLLHALQGSLLALHYCLLAALVPLPVAIGHILLGGWLTATLVTVTHTAEEFAVEDDASFVETQFKTTRDAITRDPLSA